MGEQNPRLTPDPLPPSTQFGEINYWCCIPSPLPLPNPRPPPLPLVEAVNCPFVCFLFALFICFGLVMCWIICVCELKVVVQSIQRNSIWGWFLGCWNFKCKVTMNRTDWTVNNSKTLSTMNWPSEGSLPTFSLIYSKSIFRDHQKNILSLHK